MRDLRNALDRQLVRAEGRLHGEKHTDIMHRILGNIAQAHIELCLVGAPWGERCGECLSHVFVVVVPRRGGRSHFVEAVEPRITIVAPCGLIAELIVWNAQAERHSQTRVHIIACAVGWLRPPHATIDLAHMIRAEAILLEITIGHQVLRGNMHNRQDKDRVRRFLFTRA